MAQPPQTTARLHVLFARDAPVGVVFRRGPSKQVRLILWHTDTDTFEPGQWLKGRIYEHKAALSPNGQMLAYFAADYRRLRDENEPFALPLLRQQADPASEAAWIALSRPPYLTALALWFLGWEARGAAAFPDNRTLLLEGASEPAPGREPPQWLQIGALSYGDYLPDRRGWQPLPVSPERLEEREGFKARYPTLTDQGAVYFLPPQYDKSLTKFPVSVELHRTGWNWKPRLRNRRTGAARELEVEQAEIDPSGRLILVREGKLFAASVAEDLTLTETQLADFNDMTFEPIPPPEWATQWPEV